jgi:hypothetical protein
MPNGVAWFVTIRVAGVRVNTGLGNVYSDSRGGTIQALVTKIGGTVAIRGQDCYVLSRSKLAYVLAHD